MKLIFTLLLCCYSFLLSAQVNDTVRRKIDEVTITAYTTNKVTKDVPAAINYIGQKELNRFNNSSILQAVNATPGVRMEERSPGSYRLSIRGSALRAPFGVRNVKVYYNDIPFTDPGGNTFLNQLGFYNIQSLEIIKGPGSSMYGAGTGGVMLLHTYNPDWKQGFKVGYTGGSYGMRNAFASVNFGGKVIQNTITYQRLQSEGYRQHTNMQRDVLSWDVLVKAAAKNTLSAHFLFSDLYYQTPGALTLAEFSANPQAARPAAGAFPGAVQAKAAINSRGVLAGFTNKYTITKRFNNTTTVYSSLSLLNNPTIQNYGMTDEPHFGGRTSFTYNFRKIRKHKFDAIAGAEWQRGNAAFKTYKNRNGNPDTLLLDDEISNRQYFVFAQLGWQYRKWSATAGASVNNQKFSFTRLNVYPHARYTKTFDNNIAPRIALMYRLHKQASVYANVAKGFSPPTTAELLPTGLNFNNSLEAEYGWNYELGSKGYLFNSRLSYDISAFLYNLGNAIVVRRDAGGGNYFVNAGATQQAGLEAYVRYKVPLHSNFFNSLSTFGTYSYYRFSYKNFIQAATNYSGNALPGVAPHTLTVGADVAIRKGVYLNLTYSYCAPVFLNDANTASAAEYHLLSARAGYKIDLSRRYVLDVFAGADNIFNEVYSLGNDINGFGGRYYNTAAPLYVYYGLSLGYSR
jgi:iron complex outermembrane recepter protein